MVVIVETGKSSTSPTETSVASRQESVALPREYAGCLALEAGAHSSVITLNPFSTVLAADLAAELGAFCPSTTTRGWPIHRPGTSTRPLPFSATKDFNPGLCGGPTSGKEVLFQTARR